MASFGGDESKENGNDDNNPSSSNSESDNKLKTETESIVRQFVYDRFEEDNERDENDEPVIEAARADALEELRSVRQENGPQSTAVRVSKRLREVGDDINLKYHDEFQEMISQLNITSSNAYTSFANVARRLFSPGISWNRIVALLCFGYEIAKSVLRSGLGGTYMKKIYQFVVYFIEHERIAAWIAQHGGWLGFLADFRLNEPSWTTVAAVLAVGVLCVAWSIRSNDK